jgi:molybdenum cofactor cytidylyltransferase
VKFGPLPPEEAEDAILAHSLSVGERRLKKGHRLTAEDIADLRAANVESVIVAQITQDDMGENDAAAALANALGGANVRAATPFTGRVNLFAEKPGVLLIDVDRINRLNRLDETLTVATLPANETVFAGQMAATIKIIPLAASKDLVDAAVGVVTDGAPLLTITPFAHKRVALISTLLPQVTDKMIERNRRAVADRLAPLGSTLVGHVTCEHEESAVAAAITNALDANADMVFLFGASAIVDRRDVIPAGIEAAGGSINHFGMPVDPGNLLLLARHGPTPIIGLPGCARSPKLNGFDWVLHRLLAEIPVSPSDIMGMGVGGLLKEIKSRPQPREGEGMTDATQANIGAIIMAAGQSRRMGKANKLLAEIDGVPMVARVAQTVCASRAGSVVVVTGHEAEKVRAALVNLSVEFTHNPDFDTGLSSSLKVGVKSMQNANVSGCLVCLGDMPLLKPDHLNVLIDAFDEDENRTICVPTTRGKRGNPVLWGASLFDEMAAVTGDVGARALIGEHQDLVCEVDLDDDAVFTDVDTPAALKKVRED